MKRNLLLALLTLLVAALASACSGASLTSVKPQLEAARTLNNDLTTEWQATETMLTETQQGIADLPKVDIDPKKVDIQLLKKALVDCFNAPVKAAEKSANAGELSAGQVADKTVAKCEGESVDAVSNLGQQADPEVNTFIQKKLDTVAMAKSNIKEGLPSKAEGLVKKYPEAKLKLEALKKEAEAVKLGVDNNPLADKKAFEKEYAELQEEIQKLEQTLSSMEAAVPGLPDRVTTTSVEFNNALTSFGQ